MIELAPLAFIFVLSIVIFPNLCLTSSLSISSKTLEEGSDAYRSLCKANS